MPINIFVCLSIYKGVLSSINNIEKQKKIREAGESKTFALFKKKSTNYEETRGPNNFDRPTTFTHLIRTKLPTPGTITAFLFQQQYQGQFAKEKLYQTLRLLRKKGGYKLRESREEENQSLKEKNLTGAVFWYFSEFQQHAYFVTNYVISVIFTSLNQYREGKGTDK